MARDERIGYWFAAPWLVGFCGLTLLPLVASILLSFCRWDGLSFRPKHEASLIDDLAGGASRARWSVVPADEAPLELTVAHGELHARKRSGRRGDGNRWIGITCAIPLARRYPDGANLRLRCRATGSDGVLWVRLHTETRGQRLRWRIDQPVSIRTQDGWQELRWPLERFRCVSGQAVELRSQDITRIEFVAPAGRFPAAIAIDELGLDRLIGGIRWVGTKNYRDLILRDQFFGRSLFNTAYYSLLSVPLGLVISLGLAMLLNQPVRGIAIFRTIYYLPHVVAGVATMMMWLWVFDPQFGLLNTLLRTICGWLGWGASGGAAVNLPGWLYEAGNILGIDYRYAKGFYPLGRHTPGAKDAMIIMSVWGAGGGMLIFLAALQNVPAQLYEAARVDGAGRWRRFVTVTLPHISPAIFFNLVVGIIASFQVFTQSYLMTNRGGPDTSTLYYVLYLYLKAFEDFQMGYASAMAWVLFVIILALTLLVVRSARHWVYYEGD